MTDPQKQLQQLVQNELTDGETIWYSEQPDPTLSSAESYKLSLLSVIFVTTSIVFVILIYSWFQFMLEFGFSVVPIIATLMMGAALYMCLKAGAPLLFAPFISKIQAKHCMITITNQKVFIVNNGLYKGVVHYFPQDIAEPDQWVKKQKDGSIMFSCIDANSEKCNRGFRGIKDIPKVESLLKQLQAQQTV